MSTQVEKFATGVWVDAMLARLVKGRNGRLSIHVRPRVDNDGLPTVYALVEFMHEGMTRRFNANGTVPSVVLKDLGKQLEAWEARQ